MSALLPPVTEAIPSGWGIIRAGNLGVHIATRQDEIEAAQALRYRVFYEEIGGTPPIDVARLKRDFDRFDPYCDHLLVLDYDRPQALDQVVGTYRLLRRSALQPPIAQFYTESEFDISAIKREEGDILELGRSCVDVEYRNRSVMQLLWRGIAAYIAQYDIKLMFGCASFTGTQVLTHRLALAYLYHYHLAPLHLRAVALPEHYIEMDQVERERIDAREVFSTLPALIKGYLRAGGCVGQGAVIDRQCNTTDVGILVKTEHVTAKYAQRYAAPGAQAGLSDA